MRSERTKKMIKRRNVFLIMDYVSFIVTTIVMAVAAMAHLFSGESASQDVFTTEFIGIVTSMAVTGIIGIVAVIFIKDKMRTTLFMVDVIIGSLVFGSIGMYGILCIWFLDEYIFHQLFLHYKAKAMINKEIDLRG